MMISVFEHVYCLIADDILVCKLFRRPSRNEFLFVSRVLDIPLDRIYAKYIFCKLVLVPDLKF